ncbi:cytochrome c oxidase subunit I+III [Fulvimarina manganoxydans]|uniref:cytochrome-c oxidase n=1 Tax=Fulvimarina manganoxydans TaxID=937218 RepID=A0A1W2C4Z7_9HYPH|nr:cytochrome c oxidase subunit I [Fulvimarina manganoxydans]MCK5931705.1 cytochrome c oxidase subunit I [Fulvimarina manganoxydans]SMC80230.1 cytochrome c oxidase subunit I+III [Fulvimarina manganoxydans]
MSETTRQGASDRDQEDEAVRRAQEERLRKVWAAPKGWRYWSAVNNTEVGVWYTALSFAFMLFAGVLALIMRAQLAVPENNLVTPDFYNQAFTLHGTAMMFLFAVPIFEAVAIILLPQLLGARDLPFPRLSAFGFWCFLIGGVFVCGSIFFGAAPTGGWFMYPPLTTEERFTPGYGADIWLLGLSFIEVASIAAAIELIVGTLKCRPPGMRLNLMPLYAWYVLVVAGMILFAFPPLIAGDILFELERLFDWPFFDPTRGGDPVLWQHLFWIFGHPEVYIVFLPAIALLAMIIPTFAQRPILGYSWIVLAAVGTGFISFGLWVHHMYTTGLPAISLGFFSAASEAVAIPTGVQIFVFLATLMTGRVIYSVPMLFVSGFLAIFVIGGLTGVMVAIAPFDWQAHDTYFVVAHLHYVLIGGMLFPVVAGVFYYWPMISGRKLSDRLGRLAFWLMFVGFNVAFFPMHFSGLAGMPRRVWTYPEALGLELPNLVSTIGAFVFAAGILTIVYDVLRPRGSEPYAKRNPWNAGTLEWLAEMPGENWGVRSVPVITSRYPIWQQPNFIDDVDKGRFYLPDAEEMKRETIVSSVLDGEPEQCLRVPGPSFMPMISAFLTGAVFILATFHYWYATIAFMALATVSIMIWLWRGTAIIPEKPEKDVGRGLKLPLYTSGPISVGWWAMFITMTGDVTAFIGLIFGYYYFFTIHEDFPPPSGAGPGVVWPMVSLGLFLAAWGAAWLALERNRARRIGAARVLMGAGAGAALSAAAVLLWGPFATGLDPASHVYPATVWVLAIWTAAHGAVGALMLLYCLARSLAGRFTSDHDIDIANVTLYWHFMAGTALVTVATLALFPLAA